jgi:hypothetical protein
VALRALGRVAAATGAREEGLSQLRAALDTFAAIPAPLEVARTHLVLAEVTQALERRDEALEHLTDARNGFVALGTTIYRRRAEDLGQKLGLRLKDRQGV